MKEKRRYLRKGIEKTLMVIFMINGTLLLCLHDFEVSLQTILVICSSILLEVALFNILKKYGRLF